MVNWLRVISPKMKRLTENNGRIFLIPLASKPLENNMILEVYRYLQVKIWIQCTFKKFLDAFKNLASNYRWDF